MHSEHFWREGVFGRVPCRWIDLPALAGEARLARMPFALRVLIENVARNVGDGWNPPETLSALLDWSPQQDRPPIALRVSRVVLPDSSGLPVLMDLAALRDALVARGQAAAVEPRVPVDLVIDHSVMVDFHGSAEALQRNMDLEFERNAERYRFFKWARQAFGGLRVVPPGMGIIHQVHLERLAQVVAVTDAAAATVSASTGTGPGKGSVVHPEFVLGGDSHTPMVNGLGVLAWGVGGVEIEAAMLGQPYLLQLPRFVGVELVGRLAPGVTTTDLVLTVTQRLRAHGVVDAIVEFFGAGCDQLPVADRATIANMAPEYGANAAYFPIDAQTLAYLKQTGRPAEQVERIEAYARRGGLFREPGQTPPAFEAVVTIDLASVEPSVAGPLRPQDLQPLAELPTRFGKALRAGGVTGFGRTEQASRQSAELVCPGWQGRVTHGVLAIAAITACTNTSNPGVMLAAGLLARNAVRRGLRVPPFVKTSMAPGSRVVSRYLEEAGLMAPLQALGFHVVGYGCTTCSGKSGPLVPALAELLAREPLVAAAVTSSNRNFSGRVHRQVGAVYLASPPLVVAFALAGRVDIDLTREPLGVDEAGEPVYLRELWPADGEIEVPLEATRVPALYLDNYASIGEGTDQWQALAAPQGPRFPWSADSTYLLPPPFFSDAALREPLPDDLHDARVLAAFGDSLTTDHISPAGEIAADSEAGRLLAAQGVAPARFNAFTMRRGNHHVMMRGTFAGPRPVNRFVPGQAGVTRHWPDGEILPVHEAARRYRESGVPQIILGGCDYGMGSSRDWAAKGPRLLGVRAVIACSFERIHRANLVALGIVPLLFPAGESAESLGLTGAERISLPGLRAAVCERRPLRVRCERDDGTVIEFEARPALQAPAESSLIEGGGIFARVLAEPSEPSGATAATGVSSPVSGPSARQDAR